MKFIASRITASFAAIALVVAPVAALANTRASEMTANAQPHRDDDGAAGTMFKDKTGRLSRDWMVTLFGTVGTIGALAILFSGKSAGENPRKPRGGSDGQAQSNGAG